MMNADDILKELITEILAGVAQKSNAVAWGGDASGGIQVMMLKGGRIVPLGTSDEPAPKSKAKAKPDFDLDHDFEAWMYIDHDNV